MGVRSRAAVGAGLVLVVAGCAGDAGTTGAPTTTAGVGSAAYTCDQSWECAGKVAVFVGADVLYPSAGGLATSQYTAQRGVVTDPSDPRADPDSDLVAASYVRDGVAITLLGRTGVAATATAAAASQVVEVRGVPGELAVCPSTAHVTWTTDGWVWTLSAPDSQTALAEADALQSTAGRPRPGAGTASPA